LHYAQEDLPFGGVGMSGMGAYHAIEGFKTMSHAKGRVRAGEPQHDGPVPAAIQQIFRPLLKYVLR
jgi:coniferyl-aldehyde dehydrogenase